jgi:hypothetical protein
LAEKHVRFRKNLPRTRCAAELPAQTTFSDNRAAKLTFEAIAARRKKHNLAYFRELHPPVAEADMQGVICGAGSQGNDLCESVDAVSDLPIKGEASALAIEASVRENVQRLWPDLSGLTPGFKVGTANRLDAPSALRNDHPFAAHLP